MSNAQTTIVAMDAQASNSSNVWASAHQRVAAIAALISLWAMKGHVRYSYLAPTVVTAPKPISKVETINGLILLPVGEQPFEGSGDGKPAAGVARPGSRATLERIKFLESLNPVALIAREIAGFGRSYAGFVFETRHGRIAVLEANATSNAAYLFNADDPQWVELAQKSKAEVLNSGHPAFKRRLIHDASGRWQDRLRDTLS